MIDTGQTVVMLCPSDATAEQADSNISHTAGFLTNITREFTLKTGINPRHTARTGLPSPFITFIVIHQTFAILCLFSDNGLHVFTGYIALAFIMPDLIKSYYVYTVVSCQLVSARATC